MGNWSKNVYTQIQLCNNYFTPQHYLPLIRRKKNNVAVESTIINLYGNMKTRLLYLDHSTSESERFGTILMRVWSTH